VVVISKPFLSKNWAQYELDGLVTREMSGAGQVILPIWHEISKDEIIRKSPTLADKLALRTSDSHDVKFHRSDRDRVRPSR